MPTSQSLFEEFATIDNYIKAVREVLQEGHMPDMVGLDQRVSSLCAALAESEPEIQKLCLPKLTEMLERLDECEHELRAFHDAHIKDHL